MPRLISLLLGALLLCTSAFAFAGQQDFLLLNRTGIEIRELYVSPHDAEDWQEDVLRSNTLRNGASVRVSFSSRERADEWDIKIVDGDGESLEWSRLDFYRISLVTLYLRKGQIYAEVK